MTREARLMLRTRDTGIGMVVGLGRKTWATFLSLLSRSPQSLSVVRFWAQLKVLFMESCKGRIPPSCRTGKQVMKWLVLM